LFNIYVNEESKRPSWITWAVERQTIRKSAITWLGKSRRRSPEFAGGASTPKVEALRRLEYESFHKPTG
jgi:hypothetical protein